MSIRLLKVKNDLQNALGSVFIKLNLFSVVLKDIQISKDLRYVNCEIASFNEDHITSENLLKFIQKKEGLIKKELKNYLSFKYFPKIRFVSDSHSERIESVTKILDLLKDDSSVEIELKDKLED